jgi:hypothetical protein
MERINEQDLARFKDILAHASEFIAYFELADTKMLEWRQDIEHQASQQEKQLHLLQADLNAIQQALSQNELHRFYTAAEVALNQGKDYLLTMQITKQTLLRQLNRQQRELNELNQQAITKIAEYGAQISKQIDKQLSNYDTSHFQQLTHEHCTQMEQSARNTILKSEKLVSRFQWHTIMLTVFTTLLTTCALGLYLSSEYPWEVHQHVMNERDAGKILINAWPILTQEEKTKILSIKTA